MKVSSLELRQMSRIVGKLRTKSYSGGSSYGWTGRPLPPPMDQNLGLVVAARSSLPHTLGKVFILILKFWPLFSMKMDKKLSASGGFTPDPPSGALPLGPAGGCVHRLHLGSRSPWSVPHLANPRSATEVLKPYIHR